MRRSVSVAIVGGGVSGCSIAYHLAKLGCNDVAVYERGFLASGSTGRCAAGIRAQWGTEMNCRLALSSIRKFERLAEELDYPDIELKQGGYLILAFAEKQLEQFARNVALQHRLGIPSRLVGPEEARSIVPHLAAPGLLGATFCETDGHANPFRVTDAYALAARRLGAEINTHTEVEGFSLTKDGERITGLRTDKGPVDCDVVVDAAGPYSAAVAEMAGVPLPVYSQRHQILVTEPVEPLQGPMVISFSHGFYCQQLPNGSFVTGIGDPAEPKGRDTGHSWQFLADVASRIVEILPLLARLRVVRQWSGLYNVTPDAQPILGPAARPANFWLACGFSGQGFMLGPMVGLIIAQMILGLKPEMDMSLLDLGRFARGELVVEPSVV